MKKQELYHFPQEEIIKDIHFRIGWLVLLISIFFFSLLVRSWYLQIIKGEYFKELSENNRIRTVSIKPPRGLIYDRNGNLFVNNSPEFNLYLLMEEVSNKEKTIEMLSQMINLTKDEIKRIIENRYNLPFLPLKIKGGLSLKEVALIESHRMDMKGILIEAELQRNYIYGKSAAHLLGYVGEISPAQMQEEEFKGVQAGQIVGQYGIERTFDSLIRGINGEKRIEVNAYGNEMKLIDITPPTQGKNIYLTLDLNLQKVAEEALGEESGAIVAMDPNTGEILAAVSHPGFDPNFLTRGMRGAEWQDLISNPEHPFTNRAIQGQYPPGSMFKIVVATAALETGKIDPSSKLFCRGGFPFGNRVFKDWKKGGHGPVDLHRAIVESCDIYFYELGRRLGIDDIAYYGDIYGLGKKTGIELHSEKGGTLPSTEWKRRVFKQPWYPGETISVAIGQGYVTVTPLQMVSLISAVATGSRYKPQILKSYINESTGEMKDVPPTPLGKINVNQETLNIIKKGLEGVVSEPHGTGGKARSDIATVAGKTGTAQVIALRETKKGEEIPKEFRDHAWFVSFAPVENPKIAVIVLVEHGGHGGSASAPLAKMLIEEYLKNDRSSNNSKL